MKRYLILKLIDEINVEQEYTELFCIKILDYMAF